MALLAAYILIFLYLLYFPLSKLSRYCKEQLDTGGVGYTEKRILELHTAKRPINKYIIQGPITKCEICFINPATKVNGLNEQVCVQC